MKKYLHPTDEAAMKLFGSGQQGEVVMLNLLRFNEVADYSESPELKPKKTLSGAQAYQLYMQHTAPFLQESGGELMFYGESKDYFIGPTDEKWDVVMLVKQNSLQDFMAFATNEGYLKGLGHRTAALSDSRLLPIQLVQPKQI
jgi:uncharacterized protein (DUF1330 family)